MLLTEREVYIPYIASKGNMLHAFSEALKKHLAPDETPIRFAVIDSMVDGFQCEVSVIKGENPTKESIFEFIPRIPETTKEFNAVMIIPTGIGAEIGGHAGDATPAARLLAGVCDTLIVNPNVVNASDINEMPENSMYVEGSVITRLLMGTVGLEEVNANRILLVMDEHPLTNIEDITINGASAARATLGVDISGVVKMHDPIILRAEYSSSGNAVGRVEGLERLIDVLKVRRDEYDAIALLSRIEVPEGLAKDYFASNGNIVNPWGGVEAMLTHSISSVFNIPSAHAPMASNLEDATAFLGVVDPRMSAEAISSAFMHCVLKGLRQSPRIVTDRSLFIRSTVLTASNISCLVIPDGCIGLPVLAAMEQGIPVIAVKENSNRMENDLTQYPFKPGKLFIVKDYLEAVGVMVALQNGITTESLHRPLEATKVECT